MTTTTPMKLTLGPVLFNWEPDVWRDFYFRIADEAAVDAVAVGEVVCSKRMPFFDDHFPAVRERLTAAGKQVLVSSLALVTLERERKRTAELAKSANGSSRLTTFPASPISLGGRMSSGRS
ncbi:collagenase-like PrtC family protease [Bradyrhizobium sp. AZCC 1588]